MVGISNTPIKILTDEAEEKIKSGEDFFSLAQTISKIVQDSDPRFTIGIYGEWGTGKTTLMNLVKKNLEDVDGSEGRILTVWFNAWRYEREENFATIALMKTIGYEMKKHEKFSKLSETVFRGIKILGEDLLRRAAVEIFMTEKGAKEFGTRFSEKTEFLNKLEKDTIYFDGIEAIKTAFKKIRRLKKDRDYRVVVFIDDLDRCSPKKALEVLESIKVFLDIEGFVYIIGMSRDTIDRLITHAYKETGIEGKEYIKKIIQIPIKIPNWYKEDILNLIERKYVKKLNRNYSNIIKENANEIVNAVKPNPREIKRFINNLIIAFEAFNSYKLDEKISFEKLFFVQVMKYRFPKTLQAMTQEPIFKNLLVELALKFREYRRIKTRGRRYILTKTFATEEESFFKMVMSPEGENESDQKRELARHAARALRVQDTPKGMSDIHNKAFYFNLGRIINTLNDDDWKFFEKFAPLLKTITNWTIYTHATEVVEEIPYGEFLKKENS